MKPLQQSASQYTHWLDFGMIAYLVGLEDPVLATEMYPSTLFGARFPFRLGERLMREWVETINSFGGMIELEGFSSPRFYDSGDSDG